MCWVVSFATNQSDVCKLTSNIKRSNRIQCTDLAKKSEWSRQTTSKLKGRMRVHCKWFDYESKWKCNYISKAKDFELKTPVLLGGWGGGEREHWKKDLITKRAELCPSTVREYLTSVGKNLLSALHPFYIKAFEVVFKLFKKNKRFKVIFGIKIKQVYILRTWRSGEGQVHGTQHHKLCFKTKIRK